MSERRDGVRFRDRGGTVTVLVDGVFCDDSVSVTIGSRTLNASNACVEAIRVVHGTPMPATLADDLDALRTLVGRACRGDPTAHAEIADVHARIVDAGNAHADAEAMVSLAMLPDGGP
jgi:hypothetical protein